MYLSNSMLQPKWVSMVSMSRFPSPVRGFRKYFVASWKCIVFTLQLSIVRCTAMPLESLARALRKVSALAKSKEKNQLLQCAGIT
jgi:hypothetical protein